MQRLDRGCFRPSTLPVRCWCDRSDRLSLHRALIRSALIGHPTDRHPIVRRKSVRHLTALSGLTRPVRSSDRTAPSERQLDPHGRSCSTAADRSARLGPSPGRAERADVDKSLRPPLTACEPYCTPSMSLGSKSLPCAPLRNTKSSARRPGSLGRRAPHLITSPAVYPPDHAACDTMHFRASRTLVASVAGL